MHANPCQHLRRMQVPTYLLEKFNVELTAKTLEAYASRGVGPEIVYFGRTPLYPVEKLDAWVRDRFRSSPSSLQSDAQEAA